MDRGIRTTDRVVAAMNVRVARIGDDMVRMNSRMDHFADLLQEQHRKQKRAAKQR